MSQGSIAATPVSQQRPHDDFPRRTSHCNDMIIVNERVNSLCHPPAIALGAICSSSRQTTATTFTFTFTQPQTVTEDIWFQTRPWLHMHKYAFSHDHFLPFFYFPILSTEYSVAQATNVSVTFILTPIKMGFYSVQRAHINDLNQVILSTIG